MEKSYRILLGSEVIGTALVSRRGLYYQIHCKCDLTGHVPYKVIVTCHEKQVDLGLCVPLDDSFGLQTQIPVKRLGEGELCFCAVPRRTASSAMFVPISESEPFRYLSKLGSAYLEKRVGQTGVSIQADSSKPTGQ